MSLGEPWPQTARVNQSNHLEIGGCDLTELAHEFGTPLYVFDHATLIDRAVRTKKAFTALWERSTILYATKAYFSPFLARFYRDLDLGLDVTSEAELEIACRIGFSPSKIYVHGNNKTAAELRKALAQGVRHFVVDNQDEINLLAVIAGTLNVKPQVLVRVSPGIDPQTHQYLKTGVVDSKFGMPISTGDAARAVRDVLSDSHLEFVGLHAHVGSQIFELEPIREAMSALLDFARTIEKRFGAQISELDIGGGWGVAYTENETSLAPETVAPALVSALKEATGVDVKDWRLNVEPGRALVAQAGLALYTVGAVKKIQGVRTYVSVDGGMGDNIRPALYGAKYTARAANKFRDLPVMEAAIAGRYCEQGDVLINSVKLPAVHAGDLIAIPAAGAYQIPMASNYNLIPRPAVVLVSDGHATVLRRRETFNDMLACDVIE